MIEQQEMTPKELMPRGRKTNAELAGMRRKMKSVATFITRAEKQMAVVRVLVTEPPGDEHANPDRHDGDVQDRAAHGPSLGAVVTGRAMVPRAIGAGPGISPGPKPARRV